MAKRRKAPEGLRDDPRIGSLVGERRGITEDLKRPGASENFDVFDMFKPIARMSKIAREDYGAPDNGIYSGGDTISTPTNNPATWAKYGIPAVVGGGLVAGLMGGGAAAAGSAGAASGGGGGGGIAGALASPSAMVADAGLGLSAADLAAGGLGAGASSGPLGKLGSTLASAGKGMDTNKLLLISSLLSGLGGFLGSGGDERESYTGYGVAPNSSLAEVTRILHGLGGAAVKKANQGINLRSSYVQPVSPVSSGGRTYGAGMAVDPAYKDRSLLQSPGMDIPEDLFADPNIIGTNRTRRDDAGGMSFGSIMEQVMRNRNKGNG